MFEENQQTEVPTNRNEEPPAQNVRRSTKARDESTWLAEYEIFPYQAVDAYGDLIE